MKQYTIMVIEDDESLRELYAIYLELDGFKLLTADNGFSALNILLSLPLDSLPDCILLDIMMPIMGGKEFLTKLQSEHIQKFGQIPIVVCSAYGEFDMSMQVVKVLSKPIRLDILGEELKKIISDAV